MVLPVPSGTPETGDPNGFIDAGSKASGFGGAVEG